MTCPGLHGQCLVWAELQRTPPPPKHGLPTDPPGMGVQGGEGGTRTHRTLTSPLELPSPLVSHRSSNLWFFPTQEGQHPGPVAVVLSQGPGPPPLARTPPNPETSSQVYKQLLREEGLQGQQGSGEGPCSSELPAGEESFHYSDMHAAGPACYPGLAHSQEQGVGSTKVPRVPGILPVIAWVGWAGGLRVGEQTGRTQRLLPHLPSSCGRKAPGSPPGQAAGRSPPPGSSRGKSCGPGWAGLGWGGSPELGVGAGVEGGGVRWWGSLVPCPP